MSTSHETIRAFIWLFAASVCLKEAACHLSFEEEKKASIKSEILIKKILQC